MGLRELKWFISPSYWYLVMESVCYQVNCNLCAWLISTSQHWKAPEREWDKRHLANQASDFSFLTISYHCTLRNKTKMQLDKVRCACKSNNILYTCLSWKKKWRERMQIVYFKILVLFLFTFAKVPLINFQEQIKSLF